jgi:hypothetical protein
MVDCFVKNVRVFFYSLPIRAGPEAIPYLPIPVFFSIMTVIYIPDGQMSSQLTHYYSYMDNYYYTFTINPTET